MKIKVTPLRNEEEKLRLSLKGCAIMALVDSGLIEQIDDDRFDDLWPFFEDFCIILEKNMKISGYIRE